MEWFSSKRIALKVDVIGPENVLFACTSLHHTGCGSEGVNNQRTVLARVECCHAWSDWPDNLSFSLQGQSQPYRQRKDPSHPQSVESRGYALSVLRVWKLVPPMWSVVMPECWKLWLFFGWFVTWKRVLLSDLPRAAGNLSYRQRNDPNSHPQSVKVVAILRVVCDAKACASIWSAAASLSYRQRKDP